MNAYPIEISQLSKDFGKTRVLNNVNLTVAHGTVHGFLGPNGA
ncbi:MAG: ABC transporter ATP-binding protein, partial [Corynebacterium matruchotii]